MGTSSQFSGLIGGAFSLLDSMHNVDVLVLLRPGQPWRRISCKPDMHASPLSQSRRIDGSVDVQNVDFLFRVHRLPTDGNGLPIEPDDTTVVNYGGRLYAAASRDRNNFLYYEDDDKQQIRFSTVDQGPAP
jgi:hypothetical protein